MVIQVNPVQFSRSILSDCDPMDCSTPGLSVHRQFPDSTETQVHWVGDAIQPSHPLSSTSPLPSIFPSIRVFSNDSTLHQVAKVLDFSFNINPSNEHPGLISLRMDWVDLLAVQGILKSLQHHSSKASILWCSASFMVQLLHPYMTAGKPWLWQCGPLSAKWCLLFNTLSRIVIPFLPRSKHFLISWLQSQSSVIL